MTVGTVEPATGVVRHAMEFESIGNPPEPMAGRVALGLKLQRDRTGMLVFRRGNKIAELGNNVREISRSLLDSALSSWGRLPAFVEVGAGVCVKPPKIRGKLSRRGE